jgi:mono/diheme cytochrome c family protein
MKLAALLFAAVALVACGTETEDGSELVGDVTAGEVVWTANACVNCHGADGKSGSAGKDIVSTATNEASEFSNVVLNGDGGMPSFDLTDQQVADLTAYVASL